MIKTNLDSHHQYTFRVNENRKEVKIGKCAKIKETTILI